MIPCAGRHVLLLLVCLLWGCATAPQVVEVRVPVPVPCVTEIPAAPSVTPDERLVAMDDYRLVLTLARERLLLIGHVAELRAVLEACVSVDWP